MRSAAVIVVLLALVAGVSTPFAAAEPLGPAQHDAGTAAALGSGPVLAQQSTVERTPLTEIIVELRDDRAAEWRIEMRYTLETENDTAAFEQFASDFESGTANVGFDEPLFERISTKASAETGRQMSIENTTRRGFVENETGVLVLSFTWTNFLEQTDDGLRLGDAFSTGDDQLWLTSVRANQNLTIQTPPGYAVNSTNIPLENNSVVIEGPRTFESTEELRVSYRPTGATGPAPLRWDFIIGGLVAVALIGITVVAFSRRRPTGTNGGNDVSVNSTPSSPETAAPTHEPSPVPEQPADDVEDEGETEDEVDLDLLSDEERVELLLERNGGRMKQANIVKETGWSDAKVSQLLSAMADNDRVEKLRLGRENLISLPDEDEHEE
ncbi:helix-turn-helix transcriptional regulator [Haloferax sp. S1W]|uniref:helix-turn-helix transcriptional regulator n=1 Tax=Haloferax sp. S1W TaxID=3377110 RepID=UPI0037C9368E